MPSGSQEFHEVTKRDAEARLRADIERLVETSSPEKRDLCRQEMDTFCKLFDRWPSIKYTRIEVFSGKISVKNVFIGETETKKISRYDNQS